MDMTGNKKMPQSLCFFVVLDPTRDSQPALQRALQLARSCERAVIHAFACHWLDESQMGAYHSRHEAKQQDQKQLQRWADEQLSEARQQGLPVELELYWNADWHRGVLDAAAKANADLILKSTFPHSTGQRLLHKTSDYTLIRRAHCPVLLVHEGNDREYQTAVAALDLSGDKAHNQLNGAILLAAHTLSQQTPLTLHVVTALDEGPIVPLEPGWVPIEQTEPNRAELAERFQVSEQQIHIGYGSPKAVLADAVTELEADLLVIGSLARKGISGALLGNTAERVVDSISCDLLIVNAD